MRICLASIMRFELNSDVMDLIMVLIKKYVHVEYL